MAEELKEKINKAIKENFVGNFIFSAEEEDKIIYESSTLFRIACFKSTENIPIDKYELIFIAIIIIAKKWNNQSEPFYDFIGNKLLGAKYEENKTKFRNQITKVIDFLYKSKKIFMLNYNKKYYATILCHSFSPISSINSFLNLCFDIYCKDLDQNFIINDPTIDLIICSLNNKINNKSDDEDLTLNSSVYYLRVGIKGLILYEPEKFKDLLNFTLKYIDKKFNYEASDKTNYLTQLIDSWWNNKIETLGKEICKIRKETKYIAYDYSQIKAFYYLENGIVKLIIPAFRISNNLDFLPILTIYNNNIEILSTKINCSGSGLIMTTEQIIYTLKEIIKSSYIKLRIIITHFNKQIYDSTDTLFRDFILFDRNKELINRECLPGQYFLYFKEINNLISYPQEIQQTSEINTYSLIANDGEKIQSKNKIVFFNNVNSKREISFLSNELNNIKFKYGEEEFKIIEGYIYVEISNNFNPKNYGVRINQFVFNLNIFPNTIKENSVLFNISNSCNVGEKLKITIFEYSTEKIISLTNIIRFNNISINYDKKYYFGNIIGNVNLVTEKFSLKASFATQNQEVEINYDGGEFILKPPLILWKINDVKWLCDTKSNATWFKDYNNGSIIKLNYPLNVNVELYLGIHSIKPSSNKQYEIGNKLYSLINTDSTNKFFDLFLKIDNESFQLDKIFIKETFINNPLIIDSLNKKIIWNPEQYIGEKNFKLKLNIIAQNNREKQINLCNEKKILNFERYKDGFYKLKIYKEKNSFFKKEKDIELLFNYNFILGNEKDIKYKNKIIKLISVALFDKEYTEKIEPLYIDSLKFLKETNYSSDLYSGNLFYYNNKNQKIYIDTDCNQKTKINPVRIEKRTENTIYLGYGLDITNNDFEFTDEFLLNSKNRMCIKESRKCKELKYIDYFEIEVEQETEEKVHV